MADKLGYVGSLHNHTHFSNLRLRDCIVRETELIDYAVELGHEVVAITDHETLSGHVKVEKYYKKVKEKNPDFKVILGNEIYLCRDGLNAKTFVRGQDKYFHLVLLARDAVGHKQLREISTKAWMRSYMTGRMRRVPTYYSDLIEIIGSNPGHIIGSTACLGGALGTQLLRFRETQDFQLLERIKTWCIQMKQVFGPDCFYLEMQPSKNEEQLYANKMIYELSHELDIPYIITTDTHYLKKEDRPIHKAYLNAQNGDREVDDFYATTYMMGTEELESFFNNDEITQTAYHNILKIKDMCEDYSLLKPLKIPELKWPKIKGFPLNYEEFIKLIPYLETFLNSDYAGDKLLAQLIIERIATDKTLQNQEAYDEIEVNLDDTWRSSLTNNTHWSAYFLNLQQVIEECWNAGTLVGPSRGSGGGFILLYLLDITQINPLREKTRLFHWRFLNPDRASVLDIDTDIEGGKRQQVLAHLRNVYGIDRVSNVATFGTEKSKSAILTAARGLGIDVDIAQYLSGMIVADRGQLRSLKQTFYGDAEKEFAPNKQFVYEMTENYPELWEVAQKIEGLICRQGIHAGGVVFVDEPFTESTALMRAPDGTICTQFELHDLEDVSLIKMDLLSVEALDKIHVCLDLLCEHGYVEPEETLRKTYEKVIGIYNLEREDPKMWEMIWNHEIENLFQMEQQSGIQGIAIAKPKTIDELAVLNSVIRLMAAEKNGEMPLNMWGRYRTNINQWRKEMEDYGLSRENIEWLFNHSAITDGICESQEGLMSLVQEEKLGGNSLSFADSARKALAKKIGPLFVKCEEEFFKNAEEKNCDMTLAHYVWDVLLRVQRGYSFCRAHTLAYSFLALQEMNLAYRFPIILWNTACLICNSGGDEQDELVQEEFFEEVVTSSFESFVEEEDEEEDDEEEVEEKKKKKTRSANYGKIASAIGKMAARGIEVSPPDINKSSFTFSAEVDENIIRYGLSGIVKIGEDLVKEIIANRPYSSVSDFLAKVKVSKPQMINLIKCGAFDAFGDREKIMTEYVDGISDKKKDLNLRNVQMLLKFNLIPDDYDLQRRVFNFNKYLKNLTTDDIIYLDDIAYNFYSQYFDVDKLIHDGERFTIKKSTWKTMYDKHMAIIRDFIKANKTELLNTLNGYLVGEIWNKYCEGNLSKWEMDSVSFYSHDHELKNLQSEIYDISRFARLPDEPIVDSTFKTKDGKRVPLFKICRIAGTVLDKNKSKNLLTLLTTDGVVTVKIFGEVFNYYDKQISERGADGVKHVIEKSFFSRGNKVVITGIRRGENFIAKKYSRTPWHLVELIQEIDDNGFIKSKGKRYGDEE